MRLGPAGDSSLIAYLGDEISLDVHRRVVRLFRALQQLRHPAIRNLHPAYCSISIDFDPLQASLEDLNRVILDAEDRAGHAELAPPRTIQVPVCYDPHFAPDLEFVSRHTSLSPSQLVEAHSAAEYFVYFLGFAPGFAYLGGLDSRLHVPRLPSPRQQVAAGSVGLAGAQTGVYPNDSPGGWQLIGRTPLRMFDPARPQPSLLQAGDLVRFQPISSADFELLHRREQR